MVRLYRLILAAALAGSIAGIGLNHPATPAAAANENTASLSLTASPLPTLTVLPQYVPYHLISQESLFAYLQDLTGIQSYSGWRNSGSSGEAEALDYVAKTLAGFPYLYLQGLRLERQSFRVYMTTEIRDSRLTLWVGGRPIEVPADGLRGARGYRFFSLYFDSDGMLNDANPDPFQAEGAPLLIPDADALVALTSEEVKGRVLFLNYSVVDTSINSDALENGSWLVSLIEQGPAGLVLVTTCSDRVGESRGSFVGEGGSFLYEVPVRRVPILYARLEDLAPAGITSWEELKKIQAAHLVLDSDVFAPGTAGNLVARIPGADPSRAVILGAHIDSPNSPGAFDDGSGAAALLEVARVLEVSRLQPPVDVYLAWFGGHEIGTYGSAHFAATHQDLLDRTLALVQMDGLGYPLDKRTSDITLMLTSYGRFGENNLPLPDILARSASNRGTQVETLVDYGLIADNSNFDVYNVPNVWLGYVNGQDLARKGSLYFHYANHMHDPYETVEVARQVGGVFVDMTAVMLSAALEIGRAPDFHVTPAASRRAVFISSHTESENVPASMLRELGMALAWEGFDVDLIPYGRSLTPADLRDAGIVVIPPTLDFPGKHSERWSDDELDLLQEYVDRGGFLVVANSACNYAVKRCLDDNNEETFALNSLLKPMGLAFRYSGSSTGPLARSEADHPITAGASYLTLYEGQGVPFRLTAGQVLYRAGSRPMVALLDSGSLGGQVLVVSDLGLLQVDSQGAKNMEFIKNIAHYARAR